MEFNEQEFGEIARMGKEGIADFLKESESLPGRWPEIEKDIELGNFINAAQEVDSLITELRDNLLRHLNELAVLEMLTDGETVLKATNPRKSRYQLFGPNPAISGPEAWRVLGVAVVCAGIIGLHSIAYVKLVFGADAPGMAGQTRTAYRIGAAGLPILVAEDVLVTVVPEDR